MANSTFPVPFGIRNGYGRRVFDHIRTGRTHWPMAAAFVWHPGRAIGIADLTAAATSQAVDLNAVAGTGNEFPSNVLVVGSWLQVDTLVAGGSISSATASVGDSGGATQLQNAVNVFTGQATGLRQTNGTLLDNGPVLETAYVPLLTVTCSHNVNTATAGSIWPFIAFIPIGTIA